MARSSSSTALTATAPKRDPLSASRRAELMAKVRGKGNRSTELHVAGHLIQRGIGGWKKHCREVTGCPDFYFPAEQVAVFVDGCFWHGCPVCQRGLPHSRREFWRQKIEANRRRDRKVDRLLRSEGRTVVRLWEHALTDMRWLTRLLRTLRRCSDD